MRITYNAPVTLTFSLSAALILVVNQTLAPGLIPRVFSVGAVMDPGAILDWLRLFTHPLGHLGWDHLLGNLAFILLLGPILEEKYGSWIFLSMIGITTVITGVLNVLVMPTGLLGASGIVFMMIVLAGMVNFKAGELPLTFILIVLLYVVKEVVSVFAEDSISQFAHLLGGACGAIFGFLRPDKKNPQIA
ncbi:rhomboid family intramembrane serine protease [Spirochaeta lutea]|uniref:Membrane protein n=1 Tax=Spirochaeta lutea TaxID=1480694 RepID=A0A098R094_9SPIO|nr:rhomboid family intramembrane serine protease [Spirochaeta lutea]KGE73181.1 membrane protein [Spirochaeta lutea]